METLPRCESPAARAGSEAAEFQRVNRCPLWRGRLNRWIIRRTLLCRPSDQEILLGTRRVLERWFARELPWGVNQLTGNVTALVRRRPLELVGELVASARLLAPAPTMAGDSFASVAVEFLYLGQADNMAWPVLTAEGLWEPSDCQWAVELVGVPLAA